MFSKYLTPESWINTFSISIFRSSNDILLFRVSVLDCLFSLVLNGLGAGFTSPKRVIAIGTDGINHIRLPSTTHPDNNQATPQESSTSDETS